MWTYDYALGAYYDPDSATYAIPGGEKGDEWTYVPAKDFATTSTIADEVGWGGLMEEGEVSRVKHPAYGGSSKPAEAAPAPAPAAESNEVLRLVVKESKILEKGSIAIVDTREDGIQLGRDRVPGGARIRLKEMEASKTHAVVFWDDGWSVVDLGSTHGTYVDGTRLSEPKTSSKPQRLKHLSKIKIGSTTFIAHIHGSWPCDECKLAGANEISLDDGKVEEKQPENTYAMNSQERRDNREVKRKREMAALREALVGDAPRPNKRPWKPPQQYHPPPQEAKPPPKSFAENMMAKQGWGGGGLGKNSDGRSTPVEVDMRGQRKGLGAADALRDGEDWKEKAKQRRYNEIRDA